MKIWLISQNEFTGNETFDSAVVIAETEEDAKNIHPIMAACVYTRPDSVIRQVWASGVWASSPDKVTVELLGEAMPNTNPGLVCSSFHAG